MSFVDPGVHGRTALAQALRAIRRSRGLSVAQVAQAMGLPRRSYEHFEAGGGRLNVARVIAFAEATLSDPYAILAAVFLDAPDIARRSCDNKLATILLLALQDFNTAAGEDMARLAPHVLISAFEEMFARLTAEAQGREADAEAWIKARDPRRRS